MFPTDISENTEQKLRPVMGRFFVFMCKTKCPCLKQTRALQYIALSLSVSRRNRRIPEFHSRSYNIFRPAGSAYFALFAVRLQERTECFRRR